MEQKEEKVAKPVKEIREEEVLQEDMPEEKKRVKSCDNEYNDNKHYDNVHDNEHENDENDDDNDDNDNDDEESEYEEIDVTDNPLYQVLSAFLENEEGENVCDLMKDLTLAVEDLTKVLGKLLKEKNKK